MVDAGSLTPWVDGAGALVTAGGAVALLVTGKSGIEPPVEGRAFLVRMVAIACGVGCGLLWWFGRNQLDTYTLVFTALLSLGVFLLLAAIYLTSYWTLCLKCRDDTERYLAGLWLRPQAKAVLDGKLDLPKPYGPLHETPQDVTDYFCNSGKNPSFLWKSGALIASKLLMCFLFLAVVLAGAVALTSGTIAQLRPVIVETSDSRVSVDIPSDVLFEFNKAAIQPQAEAVLLRVAAILKARAAKEATIAGHTDSVGSTKDNQALSERRASAVYSWLTTKGGLAGVRFTVRGYGETVPRVPNVKPDGSDDPEGRTQNRRVEIQFGQ